MLSPSTHDRSPDISMLAELAQLKVAYRRAAKQFHPDYNKSPDAARQFAELHEAWLASADELQRVHRQQLVERGVSVQQAWLAGSARARRRSKRLTRRTAYVVKRTLWGLAASMMIVSGLAAAITSRSSTDFEDARPLLSEQTHTHNPSGISLTEGKKSISSL